MHIVSISGSPSAQSRSFGLLQHAHRQLGARGAHGSLIAVRELPPGALLSADASAPLLREAIAQVARADVVLIATPIYKAAYSGLLKLFLDVLPAHALRGKTVLPLASGGSLAHLLALDYALRPVLAALGARHILDSVFATESQLIAQATGGFRPDEALSDRLDRALQPLIETLSAADRRARSPHRALVAAA